MRQTGGTGVATVDVHAGATAALGTGFNPNVSGGATFTQIGADTFFADATGTPITGTFSTSFTLPTVNPGDFLVAQVFRDGATDTGFVVVDSIAITQVVAAVPEPSSLAGLGLVGILSLVRRKRR